MCCTFCFSRYAILLLLSRMVNESNFVKILNYFDYFILFLMALLYANKQYITKYAELVFIYCIIPKKLRRN